MICVSGCVHIVYIFILHVKYFVNKYKYTRAYGGGGEQITLVDESGKR